MATCSVDGCSRAAHTRGWCQAHYFRWRRNGNVGDGQIWDRLPQPCAVEGCDGIKFASGMCSKHYQRVKARGDFAFEWKRPTGEDHHMWKGSEIRYRAAHARVRRLRGPAKDHPCVACGKRARHWAYDHQDPEEMLDADGLAYSADPIYYQAMCTPCHKRFDLAR